MMTMMLMIMMIIIITIIIIRIIIIAIIIIVIIIRIIIIIIIMKYYKKVIGTHTYNGCGREWLLRPFTNLTRFRYTGRVQFSGRHLEGMSAHTR